MNTFKNVSVKGFRGLQDQEIFRLGKCRRDYNKESDGKAILKKNDLMIAVRACPELKSFVNRIIVLCDEDRVIP